MRSLLTSAILLIIIGAQAQDVLTEANKCYSEKNYVCAAEKYKKAYADNKYDPKDKALVQFRIGFSMSEQKKYDEAITWYKDALVTKPDYGDAYWSTAGAYYNSGKYEEAVAAYNKAFDYFRNDKSSLKNLYYWAGRSNAALFKYSEALINYRLAIGIDSTISNYYASAGESAYFLKQYEDAAKYYARSILIGDPDKKIMSARYYYWGQSYFELKKFDEALAAYKGSLEYNPEYRYSQWGVAASYYRKEKYEDAIREYTTTMNFYKDDTASMKDLYYYRGRSQAYKKDYAKAIADYDLILKLEPTHGGATWHKGSAYYQQKKYKEAIPFYTKAIEIYKDDRTGLDDLYFFRGHSKLEIKDTAGAIADFEKSTSYNTTLLDPKVYLGKIKYFQKKYYEARDLLNSGMTGYKTDSSMMSKLYFYKAMSNLLTNNGNTGKTDLERSIEYDTTNREAHRYLGEVYFTASYFNLALAEFNKAVRQYANVKDSLHKMYFYRGLVYSKLAKYKEALSDYEQAAKLNPKELGYTVGVGQLAFEINEYDKVIASFTKAIAAYKPAQINELAFAYYARGRAYFGKKDKVKAKKDLEKAIEYVPTYSEAKKWLAEVSQ